MNDTADTPIRILQGDCREVLRTISSDAVDLIFTSPPYADNRRKTYGGISPYEYVDWFLPIGEELLRVLKPTGTFILNIKEKVVNGERHTYVINLIKALRSLGFFWTEEWCWHKRNSVPGKWPNRFRDGWERLLQFNKSRRFSMHQDAVMVPRGDWADVRLKNMGENDRQRRHSKVGSGFGSNMSHWVDRDRVYPSNVLYMATECKNRRHSAVFPEALPEWFVKLFTVEGDFVLDPFLGSGTTGVVCRRMNRRFCGIELLPEYVELAMERIGLSNHHPLLEQEK